MNDQINNIIFWTSFVGVAIFIVNSVHATIVLRLSKSKEFKAPDMMMTTISVTLAVMFVALAISNNLKHSPYDIQPPQSNTVMIELHKKVGQFYRYDTITKKIDTVEIFEKK